MAIISAGLNSWASAYGNQCWVGSTASDKAQSVVFPLIEKIKQLATGEDFLLILTDMGELFLWGKDKKGFFGHDKIQHNEVPGPVKFFEDKKIEGIAVGSNHAILHTRGELFTCGLGSYGQLGRIVTDQALNTTGLISKVADPRTVHPPGKITLHYRKVQHVAVGDQHTVVVADGNLFTFGKGSRGQLGHGDLKSISFPKRVLLTLKEEEKITGVAAGKAHTVVATTIRLMTFGDGSYGQLGRFMNAVSLIPSNSWLERMPIDEKARTLGAQPDERWNQSTHGAVNCYPIQVPCFTQKNPHFLIAAAVNYTVVVAYRLLFTFGNRLDGEAKEERFLPLKIKFLDDEEITSIDAKYGHIMVATTRGVFIMDRKAPDEVDAYHEMATPFKTLLDLDSIIAPWRPNRESRTTPQRVNMTFIAALLFRYHRWISLGIENIEEDLLSLFYNPPLIYEEKQHRHCTIM